MAGVALRQYMCDDGVTLDVIWKYSADFPRRAVSAMPEDPFEDTVEMLNVLTILTQDTAGKMKLLYDTSYFKEWGVNKVPIEPMRENLPPDVLAKVISCPGNLESFYPQGLMSDNVGSNEGLVRVMTKVRKYYGHDSDPEKPDPKQYMVMTVDINIFDRIIKAQAHRSSS
jgi:hypothetical protein